MSTIDRIIVLLNNRNIVPSKMMKELGFSNGLFSQWRSGLQKPSADKIFKIAEYLSVSTDYLLGRTDNPDINTNIRTGDVSGVNINGNTNTNSNIGTPSKEQDTAELVEMIQELPLVKRAKVITYIDEMKKGGLIMSTREQIHSMIDNLNDEQLNALFILLDSMKTRKSEEKTESMKAFERLEKLHRSIPDIDEKKELDEYRKEKYEV